MLFKIDMERQSHRTEIVSNVVRELKVKEKTTQPGKKQSKLSQDGDYMKLSLKNLLK